MHSPENVSLKEMGLDDNLVQNQEQQQHDQQVLLDNLLKASVLLSPLLSNGVINYESVLQNPILLASLAAQLALSAPLHQRKSGDSGSSTEQNQDLSIEIPSSPTESFRFPWPLSAMNGTEIAQLSNCSSTSSSGQSTPKSRKSPDYIKRPMNAFMIWAKAERNKLYDEAKKEGIVFGMHNSDISKMLGARWRAMTKQEKQPFIDEQGVQKRLHMEKHPNYQYKPVRRQSRTLGRNVSLKVYNSIFKTKELISDCIATGSSNTEIGQMQNSDFFKACALHHSLSNAITK